MEWDAGIVPWNREDHEVECADWLFDKLKIESDSVEAQDHAQIHEEKWPLDSVGEWAER